MSRRNKIKGETGTSAASDGLKYEKRRKAAENIATFGILLVAVAMVAPLANLMTTSTLLIYKWIYAAGAVIYTTARVVGSTDPNESMRLRRLRRLEFWAGMAFIVGGAFWFYNEARYSDVASAGSLAILRETILFSLAGAVIQIIASWMIYAREKKEKGEKELK